MNDKTGCGSDDTYLPSLMSPEVEAPDSFHISINPITKKQMTECQGGLHMMHDGLPMIINSLIGNKTMLTAKASRNRPNSQVLAFCCIEESTKTELIILSN